MDEELADRASEGLRFTMANVSRLVSATSVGPSNKPMWFAAKITGPARNVPHHALSPASRQIVRAVPGPGGPQDPLWD